jgi:hypothetical protein
MLLLLALPAKATLDKLSLIVLLFGSLVTGKKLKRSGYSQNVQK